MDWHSDLHGLMNLNINENLQILFVCVLFYVGPKGWFVLASLSQLDRVGPVDTRPRHEKDNIFDTNMVWAKNYFTQKSA